MSWLFSRALVEEFSAATCLDGEQSAQSNGMPTPQAYLHSDKTTEFSRLSRYGMTCRRLTESHGEAVLTSFLEAFPARTLVQLAQAPESMASAAVCGGTWPASWVKFDRDTSSWKTAQFSLLGDSAEFSETWPRWGLMRDGECWPLEMSALPTAESESGSWPTPNVRGYRSDGELLILSRTLTDYADYRGMTDIACKSKRNRFWPEPENWPEIAPESPGRLNPDWQEWLMGWPIGQTELKPLAMDRYHEWRQQHFEYSHAEAA